ncbi:MAG: hypothetical protein AAF730_06385 [Bacteroidota bacterium]
MPKLKSEPIRIESKSTHGWQVRFYYRLEGQVKYRSKLFSDGIHGGRDEAYAAAIAYRDAEYPRYANEYRDRAIEPYRRRDRRNNSGVPGIMFYEHEGKRGMNVHVRGHIPGEGNQLITKTLSLTKHGHKGAVREICKFRFEGLKRLHGRNNPYPSWQHLYNEIVDHVGAEYGLSRIKEPKKRGRKKRTEVGDGANTVLPTPANAATVSTSAEGIPGITQPTFDDRSILATPASTDVPGRVMNTDEDTASDTPLA